MANTGAIRAGRAFVELFADNRKLITGLRAAEYHVQAFGTKVKSIGMSMVASGTAMLSPLVASMKVFGDFEKNMNMVSTMLDKPGQFMGQFSEGIRSLAKDFGESTSVLAKGMYDILSASVDPAGALKVLRTGVKSAIGGISDTATAINGLVGILNAYGMSADQVTNVSDAMFMAVKRGIFTFTELADQIGRVAPMARAAGISFQTMLAAISTMTRQKLGMDEAVTRLANILKQAPKASKDFIGLISNYVGKGLAEILIEFPEIRAATGISALAGDFKGLVTDIDLMNNATGKAEIAFQKMTGGTLYELGRLWAVVKDIAISTGEALAPAIKRVADWMRIAGDATSKWISENKGLVQTYAAVAVGVTALGIALVTLGVIVGSVATLIGAMASVLGFILSPIGLVIAGIVGLGYAIVQYTGQGGAAIQWLGGTFDTLRSDAEMAFQGISDALIAGNMAQAAKIFWLTLKLEWVRGITFLKDLWSKFTGFIASGLIDAVSIMLATVYIFTGAIDIAIVNMTNLFWKAWNGVIDRVAKMFINLFSLFDMGFDDASAKAFNAQKGFIDQDAAARNAEMDARRKDASARRDKALAELGEWNKQTRGNIGDITSGEIAEHEKALAQARQEWTASIAEARDMRNRVQKPKEDEGTYTPGAPELPQMEMPDIGEMIAQEAAKIGTRGTFSPFAAFGLGVGSGVEERTLKATEETAKNTRQMLKEMQSNQLEFA